MPASTSGAPASTCPDDLEQRFDEFAIEVIELPPGEKALLSIQLPAEFCIVFDPVTHTTHFIDVQGEPTRERQALSVVLNKDQGEDRDGHDAARPAAHHLREQDRIAACCRASGLPTTRCTT